MWKDIEGYEGLYQVSTNGEVRSLDRIENFKCNSTRTRKGRILKQQKKNNGYMVVGLHKNGVHKKFTVHRLVAEAFLDNPNNLPVVNHINGIKTDNRVENLEFCTISENTYHATHTLHTNTGFIKGAEVTKIKTFILDENTGEVLEFESRKECEDYYGAEFRSIVGSRQCKRFKHLRLVGDANATDKPQD